MFELNVETARNCIANFVVNVLLVVSVFIVLCIMHVGLNG